MSSSQVLKLMKDKEIEYVDLRFTDPRGKLQHLTMDATIVDDEMLNDGVFFDGSSIAVLAELFKTSTFKLGSKSLKTLITLLTDSLSDKFSIQLIIVTNCELIISFSLLFIYVINA